MPKRNRYPLFNRIYAYIIRCKGGSHRRMEKTKRLRAKLDGIGIKATLFDCVNYKKEWLATNGTPNCTFGNIAKNKMFSWRANMTPVEIAIAMSHKLAVRDFARKRSGKYDFALVFEEDVVLKPHFAHNFHAALQHILEEPATRNFGVFYLWNTNAMATRSKLRPMIRDVPHRGGARPTMPILEETTTHNAGCVAYLMSKRLAQLEASRMWPISETSDLHLGFETWKKIHKSLMFLSVHMIVRKGKRCQDALPAVQKSRWTDHPCIESPLVTTAWYEGSTSHSSDLPEDFTMQQYAHKKELQEKARSCKRTKQFQRYLQ